jgi:hypothetical protein
MYDCYVGFLGELNEIFYAAKISKVAAGSKEGFYDFTVFFVD